MIQSLLQGCGACSSCSAAPVCVQQHYDGCAAFVYLSAASWVRAPLIVRPAASILMIWAQHKGRLADLWVLLLRPEPLTASITAQRRLCVARLVKPKAVTVS